MTLSKEHLPRGAKAETVLQVIIMLAIGGAAGAASFTHVHDLAAAHRQGGWLAWADAIVLELMSIASGLEIRRRRRTRAGLVMPSAVLGCAVLLSLAAQVIQAEPTPIGWIAAAVPAAGFLTMVKIALGYHPTGDIGPVLSAADRTDPILANGTVPHSPTPAVLSERRVVTARDRAGDTDDITALLPAARRAAHQLTDTGQPLTRGALAEKLRADGYSISSARASTLIKAIKDQADTGPAAGSAANEHGG